MFKFLWFFIRKALGLIQNSDFFIFFEVFFKLKPAQLNTIDKMKLTVAYNLSDTTFGWKDFQRGISVYYLNKNEEIIDEKYSYPVVPELMPIMNLGLRLINRLNPAAPPHRHSDNFTSLFVAMRIFKIALTNGESQLQKIKVTNIKNRFFFIFCLDPPKTYG